MDGLLVFLLFIVFMWLASLQGRISDLEQKFEKELKKNIIPPAYPAKNGKEKEEPHVISEEKAEEIIQTSFDEEKPQNTEQIPAFANEEEVVCYEKNNNFEQNETEKTSAIPAISEKFDIQKALLGNVFNKIGALAIIVAMIIFIGLVSPYIVLTPLMKIVLGYAACFAFIGGGFYLHKKDNMKNYSEVLLGTGFAGLFITTFCAFGLYKLISTTGVVTLGVLLLLATYFIADKMKTLSMLIIGLVGAYLTPIFAGAGMEANLYYILFINIISLVFTLRNKNVNWINIVNIVIAMLVFVVEFCFHSKTYLAPYAYLKIVFPIVLWGANIVYDVLRNKLNDIDNAFSMLNYAVLTLFSLVLFSEVKMQLALLLGAAAIGYFLLALYSRNKNFLQYKFYDYSVLINIWLIILFTGNTFQNTILWSIFGLICTLFIKKYSLRHLLLGMSAYYLSAIHGIFFADINAQIGFLGNYIPLINERTLLFGVPVLSIALSANFVKDIDKRLQNIFLFSATTLVYIFLVEEINSVFATFFESTQLVHFNRIMTLIIIGLLYALNTTKFAKMYNSVLFDYAGKIIYGVSILTLICESFVNNAEVLPVLNFRFLAYALAVGVSILMTKMAETKEFKNALIFIGTTLAYLCLVTEVNSIFALFQYDKLLGFNHTISYIIIGLLYALNTSIFAKRFESAAFDVAAKIAYVFSVITLICYSYTYPAGILPILNFRLLTYLLAILAGLKLAKDEDNEIFKYTSIVLGFMLCHSESAGIVKFSSAFQYLISLTWVLYSGAITIFGILKNKRFMINSGIFFIILSILRIFIYDLANVEAIFKLIAFLALGIILMLVSYIYEKQK